MIGQRDHLILHPGTIYCDSIESLFQFRAILTNILRYGVWVDGLIGENELQAVVTAVSDILNAHTPFDVSCLAT